MPLSSDHILQPSGPKVLGLLYVMLREPRGRTRLRNLSKGTNMRVQKIFVIAWLATVWQAAIFPRMVDAEEHRQQLTGQLIYQGEPPTPPKVVLNKDIEFCTPHDPPYERLIVDPETKGIANVVVWLYLRRGEQAPEVTEGVLPDSVTLDNAGCRLAPHICPVRTGQTLKLGNEDQVSHNANAFLRRNSPFNEVIPAGNVLEKQFNQPEPFPARVRCSIHAWMEAWLVVTDHPFVAVTGKDGRFSIEGLPAGNWSFRVWHEAARSLNEAVVQGEKVSWPKGVLTVEVESGLHDLGQMELPAKFFRP